MENSPRWVCWALPSTLKGSALPASGSGDVERPWIILFVLNGPGFSLCLSCLHLQEKAFPRTASSCCHGGAVPAALQVLAGLPGCPQQGQSSAGSRSAQQGLAGRVFVFPFLKGCGEFNKLLCCNSVAASGMLQQSGMGCLLLLLLKALTEGFLCPLVCLSIPGSALFPKCPIDWCSL